MTKKEIVSLSLKLAGIYCLITAINQLFYFSMTLPTILREGFWHMLTSITTFVSLLLSISPFILLLLFGFYLIFSNKLTCKIASSMTQEEKTSCFTFQDIQVLAFSIIGAWLLASAIPNFLNVIARITISSTSQRSVSVVRNSYNISQLSATILKIAIGIYLFSGGKGLTKLWQRLQGN